MDPRGAAKPAHVQGWLGVFFPTVVVLQLRAPGVLKPIISAEETETKKALN